MAARMLLKKKGVDYDEVLVSDDRALRQEMERRSNKTSVPQIFIGDQPIGGFDELYELEESGELDRMLNQQQNITSN
jgi:glutaredoxin 3